MNFKDAILGRKSRLSKNLQISFRFLDDFFWPDWEILFFLEQGLCLINLSNLTVYISLWSTFTFPGPGYITIRKCARNSRKKTTKTDSQQTSKNFKYEIVLLQRIPWMTHKKRYKVPLRCKMVFCHVVLIVKNGPQRGWVSGNLERKFTNPLLGGC